MTAFTLIGKDNKVFQFDYVSGVNNVDDAIIIDNTGEIIVNQGNPITWPADATDGLQAIVDVKAGTLRFGYDGRPWAATEFVVSNYVEDSAPRIFDLVDSWPWGAPGINSNPALPEGWNWLPKPTNWLLSNGTVKLNVHDWSKHKRVAAKSVQPAQVTAASMLTAALGHMEDRAKTYDAPGGERSMGKTVAAFNVITGLKLTEERGWLFMEILKQVRSQQGNYRADSYEDLVAYAALRGECAARERGNK